MRIACCIARATETHAEYVIFITSPRQQWLRKRAHYYVYTYISWLVFKYCSSITPEWLKKIRKINQVTEFWGLESKPWTTEYESGVLDFSIASSVDVWILWYSRQQVLRSGVSVCVCVLSSYGNSHAVGRGSSFLLYRQKRIAVRPLFIRARIEEDNYLNALDCVLIEIEISEHLKRQQKPVQMNCVAYIRTLKQKVQIFCHFMFRK
jgi:hypothetical protein